MTVLSPLLATVRGWLLTWLCPCVVVKFVMMCLRTKVCLHRVSVLNIRNRNLFEGAAALRPLASEWNVICPLPSEAITVSRRDSE